MIVERGKSHKEMAHQSLEIKFHKSPPKRDSLYALSCSFFHRRYLLSEQGGVGIALVDENVLPAVRDLRNQDST